MEYLRGFLEEEDAIGVVELVLILLVLVGLVAIFKNQLESILNDAFSKVSNAVKKL
ncbi:MAG: hypothetical protein K6F17_01910 [Lachnospiraceae bacterium]|nr:hypothetical protein [Lachnospiraceae bacterium]